MFERFTDRARQVVVLAQEEARLLNHNRIGTEHLLLGLLREGEGVAAKALTSLRIDLGAVRERVEEKVGRSSAEPRAGHIPFTSRAKLVLELSLREALQLGHNYIGTEHILLGMTREGEGVAAQVLVDLGTDLNRVREQVIGLLRDYSVERPAGPASPRSVRRPSSGVPGRSERALLSGLRAELKEIEARLTVVEQRVGFGPDVSELDEAIVRTLGEKHAAADAQDYEQAAVLRNTERMLRAEKESKQRQWSATHPDLSSLAETVRQLDDQVRLLRALLSQHGIEQASEPESGAGETA